MWQARPFILENLCPEAKIEESLTTITITRAVIEAARERNMDCIIAPYEADAQMAYLNMCGLAQVPTTTTIIKLKILLKIL